MTEEDVRKAHVHIRKIDKTIPDEVLDLMRDSALEKLREMKKEERQRKLAGIKDSEKRFARLRKLADSEKKRTFAPRSKPRTGR